MNKVVLSGRVAGQPVVREFGNKKILSFSIAVSEKFAVNGEERQITSFFDIEAVGSASSTDLKKGDLVSIEGRLRQDRWESPDGKKMSKVKVVAFKISPQNLPEKVPEKASPEKTEITETTAETKNKKTKKPKAVAV